MEYPSLPDELVRDPYKLPSEPRTCETCDQVFDWIKKNTGWSICDPDTGDVDRSGETYRELFDIVNRKPRSPQSADVEMVREVINKVTLWISSIICQCETGDRETPDHVCDRCVILAQLKCSLAALDRIAGVLRG